MIYNGRHETNVIANTFHRNSNDQIKSQSVGKEKKKSINCESVLNQNKALKTSDIGDFAVSRKIIEFVIYTTLLQVVKETHQNNHVE